MTEWLPIEEAGGELAVRGVARDFVAVLADEVRWVTMKNVAGMSYFSSASITAGVVSGFGPSSNVNATMPDVSSPSIVGRVAERRDRR